MTRPSHEWSGFPVVMGIGAIVIGALLVASLLAAHGWNPTALIKFSPTDGEAYAYAEGLLGDVVAAPGLGHDGKFYFSQAMDPLYLEPATHAVHLDRPTYRAQRMLYPTIAAMLGLAGPTLTAWALIGVNLLGLGVGTAATSLLAREMGLSSVFGAAFVFNPGVLVASMIDTAEVLATLFFVLSVLLVLRNRQLLASLALTGAVLSRETMVIAVVGLAVYTLWMRRRVPWHLALPVVIPGLWWVYLRARLGGLTDTVQDTQAVGAPFEGFLGALGHWVNSPVDLPDLVMGVVLMAVAGLLVWRAFRSPNVLGAMVAGFSVLAVMLAEPVWMRYFDSSRALAPMITAYVLLAVPGARAPVFARTEHDEVHSVTMESKR